MKKNSSGKKMIPVVLGIVVAVGVGFSCQQSVLGSKEPAGTGFETAQQDDSTFDYYDQIARNLTTTETANVADTEVALDYLFYEGKGAGKAINEARKVTGDMEPLINGGWKAYMVSADSDYYDRDYERYLNIQIAAIDSEFQCKINWKYVYDGFAEQTREEDGNDVFKGTYDIDNGTATATGSFARIEFDDFYVNDDNTAEYALGTFYWASGEKNHVFMTREKEE